MIRAAIVTVFCALVAFSQRPNVPNYDALQEGVEHAKATEAAAAPAIPSIREVGGFSQTDFNASTMPMPDPLADWDFMPNSPPMIIDGKPMAKECQNLNDAGTSPQGTIRDGHSCGCLKGTLHCAWH